jgi:hypothetical protein
MKRKVLSVILALALALAFVPAVTVSARGDNSSTISAGEFHSLTIKSDGTLWAWGENLFGWLGDCTYERKILTPVKVIDGVKAVSAGSSHSLAIKNDGSLWAWGNNASGQLGDGTITTLFTENNDKTIPTKIMNGVMAVSAGLNHSLAIKNDGSLWAWGNNCEGQLGDGTTTDRSTPTKIMGDVTAISAGVYHSLAVKIDGSLWAWGDHEIRRISTNATADRAKSVTPVKIMDGIMLPGGLAPVELPTEWAQSDVTRAKSIDLVPDRLQSKYTQATTRAEFCALAVMLYEKQKGEITGRGQFTDTSDLNVEKMAAVGVVYGTSPGKFTPNGNLTREQAATMLARLANAIGKPLPVKTATFGDKGSISDWALEAVGQVQGARIMNGTSADKFSPKGAYTREQSIVTILRMYDAMR